MSYQDFDGKGDSKSHEKLKALRLDDFARVTKRNREQPFSKLTVLDIGCNEGFFCAEALRLGAKRVVGIDKSASFIASARSRVPEATFLHGDWWSIPNEKFDVILFLSAIHYEPEQKRLLASLRDHLSPGGTLILECGVASDQAGQRWHTVARADGPRRYPTEDLLRNDLLEGFAVRWIGPSVAQAGDPIPRYVYHCRPKMSTALLVAAPGGSGKTTLASNFRFRGIPIYDTDSMLQRLLTDKNYAWNPMHSILSTRFKDGPLDCGAMAVFIVDQGLHEALCDTIASECPCDAELFCIEGDALRHEKILQALVIKLRSKNVTTWSVEPALPALAQSIADSYRPAL